MIHVLYSDFIFIHLSLNQCYLFGLYNNKYVNIYKQVISKICFIAGDLTLNQLNQLHRLLHEELDELEESVIAR